MRSNGARKDDSAHMKYIMVGIGGFLSSIARYWLGTATVEIGWALPSLTGGVRRLTSGGSCLLR